MQLDVCDRCQQRRAMVRCIHPREKSIMMQCWTELCAVCAPEHIALHVKELSEGKGTTALVGK
jgi:hypothetical protein